MAAGTRPPGRRRAGLTSQKSKFSWGRHRILVTLLVLLGFAVSGCAGVVAYFLPAISAAINITGHKTGGHPGQVSTPTPSPGSGASSGSAFTVLLLGSDNDTKFQADHVLTQTMILVRVNPQAHSVVMFSIPRDLWVPLSGGGSNKIDTAYSDGGAAEAIQTVENNFGVQVNYWVWIGLGGLVRLVNDLGGVNVVAQMPILDDEYPYDLGPGNPYAYDRVAVLPGPQRLNGVNALEYVRSRHGDVLSDIARSQKQQQLLLDIKAAANTLGIADIPTIASSLNNIVKTDMSLTQIGQLIPLAKAFKDGNVTEVVMDYSPYFSDVEVPTSYGYTDALQPNWTAIRGLAGQYFPIS